jgi:hypothetical protein
VLPLYARRWDEHCALEVAIPRLWRRGRRFGLPSRVADAALERLRMLASFTAVLWLELGGVMSLRAMLALTVPALASASLVLAR